MGISSTLHHVIMLPVLMAGAFSAGNPPPPLIEKTVLDFTLKDIDGHEVPLSRYRGKVLLIVNVASRCGYTPQYEELEALYRKYQGQGLVILGFPANNFLHQEPGTDAEIKTFCSTTYGVTFPVFSKISVIGRDQHPLYRFLTSPETDPAFAGSIEWNFQKFLIDRSGAIVARFAPGEKPLSDTVTAKVEEALQQR